MSWLCSCTLSLGLLLGSHPEIDGSLHSHTKAESLGQKWGAKESKNSRSGDLRAKTDLKAVKANGGRWGKT